MVKEVDGTVVKGVFANKDFFELGEFLLIYRGKRPKDPAKKETDYVFAILSRTEFTDASDEKSGTARFINDDFVNPNARPYEVVFDNVTFIGFKAKRSSQG